MIAIRLPELKNFTSQLFIQETFHPFLLYEAFFVTGCKVMMEGERNEAYYEPEETENSGEKYVTWEEMKPICFQVIRGKKLPLQFKIILRASRTLTEKLLSDGDSTALSDQIEALHFMIHYKDGAITCTTGTSFRIFTMDKSADQIWDRYVLQFLEKNEIEYQYL